MVSFLDPLFLEQTKCYSLLLYCCHLVVLCCTRCSAVSPVTKQACPLEPRILEEPLRISDQVLIISCRAHPIVILKIVPKFQVSVPYELWLSTDRQTDRQTDRLLLRYHISLYRYQSETATLADRAW